MPAPSTIQPPSQRTRIRRASTRAHYDQETIAAIAGASLICHIAFSDDQGIHCIPTACWVHEGFLYIHGSTSSRMIQALAAGEACVSLAHLDGLILARSAFHHSLNYRSVVAYGRFEKVETEAEKLASLHAFIETLAAGRWQQVRQPSGREMAATAVMRLSLKEAAAKVRNWGVKDDEQDMNQPVWAGVVPLQLVAGEPIPDAGCENRVAPVHWKKGLEE